MKESKRKYMHLKRVSLFSLVAAICLVVVANGLGSQSKTATTDEGQVKLMQEIDAGQKSNQLTVKEANKLRKDLSNVARKKTKIIAKTDSNLTATDAAILKNDVDKISIQLHKLEEVKGGSSR